MEDTFSSSVLRSLNVNSINTKENNEKNVVSSMKAEEKKSGSLSDIESLLKQKAIDEHNNFLEYKKNFCYNFIVTNYLG